MFHSHGNVMSLFEDFVEAGFDSIDPLDAYDGMDFQFIKEKFGKGCPSGVVLVVQLDNEKEDLLKHIQDIVLLWRGKVYPFWCWGSPSRNESENLMLIVIIFIEQEEVIIKILII